MVEKHNVVPIRRILRGKHSYSKENVRWRYSTVSNSLETLEYPCLQNHQLTCCMTWVSESKSFNISSSMTQLKSISMHSNSELIEDTLF